MNKKIRSLKPEEIETRVQQVTAKGVQLLLYKDSRCDKRILDEVFGIGGWKDKYEEIKGNLFCTISIWDEDKNQWIDKCDCGAETFSEKEKGEASDAFKRAGFNVGIGRELYTRIFYFANVPTKLVKDKNGKEKYEMENKFEKFSVSEIFTNEETEKIEKIKIVDSKSKVVFSYGYPKTQSKVQSATQSAKPVEDRITSMITDSQVKLIQTLLGKVEKSETKIFKNFENIEAKENIYKQYGIKSSKELTFDKAKEIIDLLKKKLGE